jgi:hypothetical protein
MRISILAVLVVVAFTAPGVADLVPEGHHSVRHGMVLLPDERLEGVQLHLAPVRGFSGAEPWVPGEEAGWSGKYGTRVYALRPGEAASDDPKELAEAAFASGEIPFGHFSFLPNADPTFRIVTTVRLVSIGDGAIALEEVETRRYDRDGQERRGPSEPGAILPLLIGVAVVGAVLLLVSFSRRRRA